VLVLRQELIEPADRLHQRVLDDVFSIQVIARRDR
jgi:hypothetical protein